MLGEYININKSLITLQHLVHSKSPASVWGETVHTINGRTLSSLDLSLLSAPRLFRELNAFTTIIRERIYEEQ